MISSSSAWREFIKNHPGIHPDMIFVYFNAFGEFPDVFVYCFTRSIVWKEYLEVVHEINLGILTIAEEMDIKFAYPTRTLHIANSNADQGNVQHS